MPYLRDGRCNTWETADAIWGDMNAIDSTASSNNNNSSNNKSYSDSSSSCNIGGGDINATSNGSCVLQI